MSVLSRFILASLLIAVIPARFAAAEDEPAHPPVSFAEHVQPILQNHCAKCHDNGKAKGGLSMKSRASLLEDGEAVIPGDASKSKLIALVTSNDPDEYMPPKGDRLSDKEVAILRMWIDQGVKWNEAGAAGVGGYIAPIKPRRPTLPANEFGVPNPIDRFLAVYFQKNNIKPAPIADDSTFIRRAYLDIIGLLPPVERTRSFIEDSDPLKREKLVRELLANDREYTEHWLSFWNDHLRNDYAGTGYIDGGRRQITAWLYESLYENKPFDQFARELVNPAPASGGFASGIKWRGRVNASQVRELQYSQNVAQVFLGINMKCASCHDSFIDDWSLSDAYGLAAIWSERELELHRCDKPMGEKAVPQFVFAEVGSIDATVERSQRLEQFANLLTHENNGRFTRTIVNRIWARMMGRGLVEPVDVMANEPWNEDVLDFLAVFLADNDYDLKRLIELIATSQAYQRQSIAVDQSLNKDGQFIFRGPAPKRLTAEQFVDAVWSITGTGPDKPNAGVSEAISKQWQPRADGEGPTVRSSMVVSSLLMRSLGRPNREQVITTRPNELTTLEALTLSNGDELTNMIQKGAEKYANDNDAHLGETLFLRMLSRQPTKDELPMVHAYLGENPGKDKIEDVLWSLLLLPEFQLVN